MKGLSARSGSDSCKDCIKPNLLRILPTNTTPVVECDIIPSSDPEGEMGFYASNGPRLARTGASYRCPRRTEAVLAPAGALPDSCYSSWRRFVKKMAE